jgi:hypothetical protein
MPMTVPNYNRKTDRPHLGTLIGIPRNPHITNRKGRLFTTPPSRLMQLSDAQVVF